MPDVETFLDMQRDSSIERLLDFLRIASVSTDPAYREEMRRAAGWVTDRLREAGPFRVDVIETDGHPVVYGEWLGAQGAPTVLVYGHYDVQPPDPVDLWLSPPFEPVVRDGRIYARGASDDKGSMLIPIVVAQAWFATEGRLPINLKLVFEGEEEIGSPHLESFVAGHRDLLRADVALSADGAMWRIDLPSVITGSRGLVGLNLEIEGPGKDLHSGRHGGAVANPISALARIIASLHDDDGRVAVDGFYDGVRDATQEERAAMAALPFDEHAYCRDVGVEALVGEPGFTTLERQWIRPTLEVNGIGGGYQGDGGKTVIPSRAFAKITCRLVPDQEPDRVLDLLERHVRTHAPPGIRIHMDPQPGSSRPYRIDEHHPGLEAARAVLSGLYGCEPASVLMGGTLPVSEIFARVLGIDTVYFSFSTSDEDFHAPNEHFRIQRFADGQHAWARLWQLMADTWPSRAGV